MTETKLIEKKITVKDFVNKYKLEQNKQDFLEIHVVKNYVPLETKLNDCDRIVKSTYYWTNPVTGKSELKVMSTNTYVMFTMKMIDRYTDIELDFRQVIEEYDMLMAEGLIDALYSLIPERELKEYDMFLKMEESDLMQNEYYIGAYISNKLETLSVLADKVLAPVSKQLVEKLDKLDLSEENTDKMIDKVLNSKLIQKLIK